MARVATVLSSSGGCTRLAGACPSRGRLAWPTARRSAAPASQRQRRSKGEAAGEAAAHECTSKPRARGLPTEPSSNAMPRECGPGRTSKAYHCCEDGDARLRVVHLDNVLQEVQEERLRPTHVPTIQPCTTHPRSSQRARASECQLNLILLAHPPRTPAPCGQASTKPRPPRLPA